MKNTIITFTYINRFLMIITCALFLTIIGGMLAEILLGGFQVISALILFVFWKHLDKLERKRICAYIFTTTIYLILFLYFDLLNRPEFYETFLWVILIPMIIALYYSTILENLKKRML